MVDDSAEGKLRGELRATRKKQATLRYQVRHMQSRLERLRQAVSLALTALDQGKPEAAAELLERGLARESHDPDPTYTPEGARGRGRKR